MTSASLAMKKYSVVVATVTAVAFLVVYAPSLLATTHYVSASGNDTPPYDTWEKASHTIQTAIDLCVDGDSVLVGPGTYSPASGEQFPIQIGSHDVGIGLAIVGLSGALETVVDAQGTSDVFRLSRSAVGFKGLTIRGGSGSGVFVYRGPFSIADCRIVHNQSCGVHAEFGGERSISNSIVSDNSRGIFSEDNVTINSCSVSGNADYGVFVYGARVEDSEITGNGGFGLHTGKGSLAATRTNVTHNGGAGVVYELEGPPMPKEISPGQGGKVGYTEGGFNMEGCVVAGNAGGGVVIPEGIGGFGIGGSTISDNAGSGISDYDVFLNLSASIISRSGGRSVSYGGPPGLVTLTCCDVSGNNGGDWVGCIADQYGVNGNFSVDPLFCDPGSSDFRLSSASQCVNRYGCGQVGALGIGCGPTAVEYTSWGRIKSLFR